METPTLSWPEKLGYVALLLGLMVYCVLFPRILRPLSSETLFFLMLINLVFSGVFISLVFQPYRRSLGPNVRPVERLDDGDLARLCEQFGTAVRGVWLTDDLRRSHDFVGIFGVFPWNRHLVVEMPFFDVYKPDERVAVIAYEASVAESYYRTYSGMMIYLVIVTYFGIVAAVEGTVGWDGPVLGWPYVPEVLIVGLLALGIRYGRQKVYRADREAAEQTDVETVISVLEKFEDEKGSSDRGRGEMYALSAVWTRPSPSKRIEHLRKRFDVQDR